MYGRWHLLERAESVRYIAKVEGVREGVREDGAWVARHCPVRCVGVMDIRPDLEGEGVVAKMTDL